MFGFCQRHHLQVPAKHSNPTQPPSIAKLAGLHCHLVQGSTLHFYLEGHSSLSLLNSAARGECCFISEDEALFSISQ